MIDPTIIDPSGRAQTQGGCGIENSMSGPLDGIRIIDWTIWQQGPVATQMLADLGAEVIKIEERERGDPGRGIMAVAGSATVRSGRNYYFEANNKHKKSIALNLKQPEAREIVHRLPRPTHAGAETVL